MDKFSFLGAVHTNMIEDLYKSYLKDESSVDSNWKNFFQGFDFAQANYQKDIDSNKVIPKEFKVIDLIDAYRKRGHLFTLTNPVRDRRKYKPNLDIENYGLDKSDLDTIFRAGEEIGIGSSKLSEIISHLDSVYCQSIGVEFMYLRNPKKIDWILKKLQKNSNLPNFKIHEKQHILHKLNQAVAFESFLHKKFVGQKRFSLEGAESLIPALDSLIEHSTLLGVKECVMGMAHRGRLNVLANIFNKTYKDIFSEFEGNMYEDDFIAGDVKYHLGFTSLQKCNNGNDIKISLYHILKMDFQEDIKQWVSKDNQIKTYSERIKQLRGERSSLTERIFDYAENNNLAHAVIQITDGKLKFNNSKVTAPLTYKLVEQCLKRYFSEDESKEVIKYIKSQRESNIKSEIKRFYN